MEGLDIPETTAVPLAVHTGSVELVLCQEDGELRDVGHADRRRMLFRELSSHKAAGRLFTYQSITLATNSWIFGKDGLAKNGNTRLETSLAVPVLMSQDLSVSKLNVPASLARLVGGDRMQAIARLLLMTDLQLSVEGKPVHVH
ncbi:hypothetical protein [Arthrobacter rhombi]|uniref:hypothetical protein n=1 Tax=Arthrobacter rhombi TaxID=71253 RepID=UPI003FD13D57